MILVKFVEWILITHDSKKFSRIFVLTIDFLGWAGQFFSVVAISRYDQTLQPISYVTNVHDERPIKGQRVGTAHALDSDQHKRNGQCWTDEHTILRKKKKKNNQ